MRRLSCTVHGQRLSLLDGGGPGDPRPVLLCLHGTFGAAAVYRFLVPALPAWRVVALDQRGHGFSAHASGSDPAGGYGRAAFIADAVGALDFLSIPRAVLLGSSLGGVNAYQLAARQPQRVRGLIIEDIGAVPDPARADVSFCLPWRKTWPSLRAMHAELHPYFTESAIEVEDGWRLRCDLDGLVRSGFALRGDWWADWLGTDCPLLLLRGATSDVLSQRHAEDCAARRPHTTLRVHPTSGHNINEHDPVWYATEVRAFLDRLPAE